MQRERVSGGRPRPRLVRRVGFWTTVGVLVLLVVAFWAAGPSGPPTARLGSLNLQPPPATLPSFMAEQPDAAAIARRAEIAAEEARLAALRDARRRLERELEALRQSAEALSAEALQREAPPAATEPPESPPAPVAAPLTDAERRVRIVVLHRANSAPAAAAASAVAKTLRGSGFEVQALRGAPFVPSTPVVRYFHEEDRAAAASLAARLGQGWATQDFRAFQPQPAPQMLELWLPAS